MDAAGISEIANDLPTEPGVYQFQADETVLYVGKALDLRDRVRSYRDPRSKRIQRMLARAEDVEVAVTDTETQALLLEANLIKRHQPRYNVRLKDDKSYPLVQLTDHQYPQIRITRDPEQGGRVYGPFTDVGAVETVVKALREMYGIRGCSDHKFAGRDRPCLDYELGLCSAPCVDKISPGSYAEDVAAVERFFEGETGVLAEPMRREMASAASEEAFERAAHLRDKLDVIEGFHGDGGQAVTAGDRSVSQERDVLGVAIHGDRATVARLHSDDGSLVDRSRHRVDLPDGERSHGAVLSAFLTQFYAERPVPDALLLPEPLTDTDIEAWLKQLGVDIRVPGSGREAQLVDLALKNAARQEEQRDELDAVASLLDIPRPSRIEAMDVSHAHGTAVVGSDVVLVDGRPHTDDYRRRKLAEGNDDYAAMEELVAWRAQRALEDRDDRPDPDLLLVDGGPGQVEAAKRALDENGWAVPVVGLAKSKSTIHTPSTQYNPESSAAALHVLQRARDEAHRFAVQYHQSLRDDVSTVLEQIEGVGPTIRRRLLRRFGSVDGVRSASRSELRDVKGVGPSTADRLVERL